MANPFLRDHDMLNLDPREKNPQIYDHAPPQTSPGFPMTPDPGPPAATVGSAPGAFIDPSKSPRYIAGMRHYDKMMGKLRRNEQREIMGQIVGNLFKTGAAFVHDATGRKGGGYKTYLAGSARGKKAGLSNRALDLQRAKYGIGLFNEIAKRQEARQRMERALGKLREGYGTNANVLSGPITGDNIDLKNLTPRARAAAIKMMMGENIGNTLNPGKGDGLTTLRKNYLDAVRDGFKGDVFEYARKMADAKRVASDQRTPQQKHYEQLKAEGDQRTFGRFLADQKRQDQKLSKEIQNYEYAVKGGEKRSFSKWLQDRKSTSLTKEIQNYQFAVQQGEKMTFTQWLDRKATRDQKPPKGYEQGPIDPKTGRPTLRPIIGGPADKLSGEQAARLGLLSMALGGRKEVEKTFIGELDKKTGKRGVPTMARTPGVAYPWEFFEAGDIGRARRLMWFGSEAILRALTGAAAPDPEVERVANAFTPTAFDGMETRRQKLKLYFETMERIADIITKKRTATGMAQLIETLTKKTGVDIKGLRAKAQGKTAPSQTTDKKAPARVITTPDGRKITIEEQ